MARTASTSEPVDAIVISRTRGARRLCVGRAAASVMGDESAASECVELVNRVLKKLSRPPATFVTISDAGGAVEVSAQIYGQPVVSKTAATFADARRGGERPAAHDPPHRHARAAAGRRRGGGAGRGAGDRAGRVARAADGVRLSSQFGSALTRQLPPPRVPTGATEARHAGCRSGRRVARAADGVAAVEQLAARSRDSCRRPKFPRSRRRPPARRRPHRSRQRGVGG